MKLIGETETVTAPNAWGRNITATHTHYEVEQDDIGRARQHYLGYNNASYIFKPSDLGKTIDNMHYEGFTSWCFLQDGRQP